MKWWTIFHLWEGLATVIRHAIESSPRKANLLIRGG